MNICVFTHKKLLGECLVELVKFLDEVEGSLWYHTCAPFSSVMAKARHMISFFAPCRRIAA